MTMSDRPGPVRGAIGRVLLLAAAFVLVPPAPPARAADVPARLPPQAFSQLPAFEMPTLSPDGKRLAAVVNRGDAAVLITRPLDGGAPSVLLSADNKDNTIRWFRWVNPERLLVSVGYPVVRQKNGYAWDATETRLASVRYDGSGLINVVQPRHRGEDDLLWTEHQDNVIDWLPEDGHHVLLMLADNDKSRYPSVYKVDIDAGTRVLWSASENFVSDWITDARHRVRVGTRLTRDGIEEVIARDDDGAPWRTLWRAKPDDPNRIEPLGFGRDPDQLIVLARHDGVWAVQVVNLKDPGLKLQIKLAEPLRNLSGLLLRSPADNEPIGLQNAATDGAGRFFWDADTKALMSGVDAVLPHRANVLHQAPGAHHRYLIESSGNGQPAQYFLGDSVSGTLKLLADAYPLLPAAQLPKKQPRTFVARDGLLLNSLLTLPLGAAPSKLPLVVMPHGGPWSRDSVFFDDWSAFVANQGYAVLQVNFRGSTDQDQAFVNAGDRQWGLAMQDDLSDAVDALVAQGVVDPRRVAIVGSSYGGYAALMGGIREPQRYRCVVAFAPASDLVELSDDRHSWGNDSFLSSVNDRNLGSRVDSLDRLRATSPRLQAAKMGPPVLLLHGTNDRSVPVKHSRWMADALRDAHKEVRYIEQEGGDHHLSHQAFRSQWFEELGAFLAKHLGPGAGPAP